MQPVPQAGRRLPRLNPFLFPSDTDFRFTLLIVAIASAGFYIYLVFFTLLSYTSLFARIGDTFMECAANKVVYQSENFPTSVNAFTQSITGLLQTGSYQNIEQSRLSAATPYDACVKAYQRLEGYWMLGGVLAILFLAFLLYWTEPRRKIRRERLQPLTAEDVPEVLQALGELCREAELKRPPAFVWNPLNPIPSGLAFGSLGRNYVALTGGLVTQFYSEPARFRAILRHELAHLRNADVDKTYFALAAWQAFVMLGLLPFVVDLIVSLILRPATYGLYSVQISLNILVLAGVVYLFRNGVLRAREAYADVRASVWDGPQGALPQVVRDLPQPPRAFLKRWLSVHPDPQSRLRAVEDTRQLLHVDFWTVLGAGLAATIAYDGVDTFFNNILPMPVDAWSMYFSAPVFALLIAALVGLIVWRSAFAGRTGAGPGPRYGWMGFGLTLGLGVGEFFSFRTAVNFRSLVAPATGLAAGLVGFVLDVFFYGFCFLLFWCLVNALIQWLAGCASVWLETNPSRSRLWLVTFLSVLVFGSTLAYFMGIFLQAQAFLSDAGWTLGVIDLLSSLFSGFLVGGTLLIPLGIAVFPLLAVFWQKKTAGTAPEWAYLDRLEAPVALPAPSRLRPVFALLVGLIGAAAYIALVVVVRLVLHYALPAETRATDLFKVSTYLGGILIAGLLLVPIGLVVFFQTRVLRFAHAVLGILAGGVAMGIGFDCSDLVFGGQLDGGLIFNVINFSIKIAFGLAIFVILAFILVGGGVRLLRGRPAPA